MNYKVQEITEIEFRIEGTNLWIDHMFVPKSLRMMGVGKRFFKDFILNIKNSEAKIDTVQLISTKSSRMFWRKCRFTFPKGEYRSDKMDIKKLL